MTNITEEQRELLRKMLQIENNLEDYNKNIGWTWTKVQCYPATIHKLLIMGLVKEQFHSNSMTAYLLTEEGKLLAQEVVKPVENTVGIVPDLTGMFDNIVGYEDVKEAIKAALEAEKPVHILLHGPPAIAKSLFLWEVERIFGHWALPFIGSATSKSGMWDKIADVRPKILLIDELEKMKEEDMAALLSLMQYGRIIRSKVGREMDTTITCWVLATANRIHMILPEVLSRFAKFQLREYDDNQFVQVVKVMLEKQEGCTADNAALIAEELVGRTHDIRDAVRVARVHKRLGVKRAVELFIR